MGQAAEPLPQQMSLQSIASMFGNSSTPLTAADLQKYQSAGLNLANFPSLPSVCHALSFSGRISTCPHLAMQALSICISQRMLKALLSPFENLSWHYRATARCSLTHPQTGHGHRRTLPSTI